MEEIILVGYGGHAKSVADCIERGRRFHILGYVDNERKTTSYQYLGTDDVLNEYYLKGVRHVAICIGYLGKGNLREKLYGRIKRIGFSFPVITDPSACLSKSAIIEEGTFIGKGAILNAEAHVGKMCIINTGSIIEHECVLGDFVLVAVAAVLCGQVTVGEAAFIGANATVIQNRKILSHQIVPAGTTIR